MSISQQNLFLGEAEKEQKEQKEQKKQRKEKVHELRNKKKKRNENPDGSPVYFHLLRGRARDKNRKGLSPNNSIFSDPPPPFRITEYFPRTAQNLENPSEKCCINLAHQV
jgi:hypothetical protein